MTNAIISGATGFIGAHLAAELAGSGVKLTALCRENSRNLNRLPAGVNIVFDMDDLPEADVFYHLAWDGASGAGRADAALQNENAGLTIKALLAACRTRCKRFIALGTVYERLAPQILASGRFGGPDFYILSKEYAHSMACKLAYKLGIELAWCTICHPIGKMIKPDQLMAWVAADLLAGKSPPLGPAMTAYDIVAVEDVALGMSLLGKAEKLTRREYYIGSGSPKPLRAWLTEARDVLGVKTPLGFGERPDDGLRFEESWFDITHIKEDTGYAPRVNFADAVLTAVSENNAITSRTVAY